jgi:hypothetical protein
MTTPPERAHAVPDFVPVWGKAKSTQREIKGVMAGFWG